MCHNDRRKLYVTLLYSLAKRSALKSDHTFLCNPEKSRVINQVEAIWTVMRCHSDALPVAVL